jgi:hypothetical protein
MHRGMLRPQWIPGASLGPYEFTFSLNSRRAYAYHPSESTGLRTYSFRVARASSNGSSPDAETP